MAKSKAVKERTIGMERRSGERRQQETPVAEDLRKVPRRRQIDPTTCERDYSDDEIEFMQALDNYKRDSGRMFPTCSEILEVLRSMGYAFLNDEQREILGIELQKLSVGAHAAGAPDTSDEIEEEIEA